MRKTCSQKINPLFQRYSQSSMLGVLLVPKCGEPQTQGQILGLRGYWYEDSEKRNRYFLCLENLRKKKGLQSKAQS